MRAGGSIGHGKFGSAHIKLNRELQMRSAAFCRFYYEIQFSQRYAVPVELDVASEYFHVGCKLEKRMPEPFVMIAQPSVP